MATVKMFVGPPVPTHIQQLRELRRKQQTAPAQESENESSDDDDFGPQLPAAEESDADALERLRQRELADQAGAPRTNLGADRSSWMSVALGGPTSGDVSYNPKTFRRNVTVQMDKSWTETQAERSKRQADEMMGIKTRPVSPPRKTLRLNKEKQDEDHQTPSYDEARAAQPSLLEEHMARRAQQKREEEKKDGRDKSFDWERDMKGGRGGNGAKVAEFVNQARAMNDKFARESKR
ncbi:hypothetical protein D0Z00_002000 [Geotrichum galactomycetum]|uniref:Uncharacterized protein n=1 Tax=Geotrichum galactomycetum TaxID=27317 RepID=A0ACB6V5K8_9ASCO|nr:hypothetical protein D0Z00_002000 [Geotrichum candidum]